MAIKKNELYSSLWESCDKLRGGMDASQYKDYILTLLFVKYVTDKFKGQKYADINVPAGGSFDDLVALKNNKDIGEKMDKAIAKLAEANNLTGVIDNAKFFDNSKFGNGKDMVDTLTGLVSIFERPEFNFSNNKAGGDDILGDAYEYLMRNFATESGKSKGQFYTPAEVSRILAKVIGLGKVKNRNTTIYDPACGSGSLLIRAADEAPFDIAIYGQEKETTTAGLAKMNLVLHNKASGEIKSGNTFSNPQYLDNGALKRFDFVVANPPFSLKNWTDGLQEFGRFDGYDDRPPEKNGDYAWLLHILKSLKPTGKAAVILPHGVLFRGNAEESLRKNIIDRGYIKGIIGLPANLFYGTGIPACIIVMDKEDAAERQGMGGGIFMIDASHDFVKDGPKNRLRERDIYKIVQTFVNRIEDDPKYARFVPMEEIKVKNGYNLNIPRYIDSGDAEDEQSIDAHLNGGIPASDVDSLKRYWDIFPSLKNKLFKKFRAGYYQLKVEKDEIRGAIFNNEEFKAYAEQIDNAFDAWLKKSSKKLMNIDGSVDVKKFIIELSESLIDEFRHIELVDFYDVYQVLLAYWQETMSDDVFVLKYDGYMAGAEIVKIFKKESKKDDGKKKAEPKEIGWEGKLLPKTVIERVYFAKEQAEIERAEQIVAESESRLEEFVEENSGEGGVLADYVKEESEDLDTKKIAAKLKELKKQKTTGEEFDVLAKYTELASTAKNQAGIVKELNKALDESVKNKYAELTEKEIKELLVKQKWSFDIFEGIKSLYDTTSHKIATRVTELADRYENTLPDLEATVADYETKVKNHLKEMGFEV
ncbi:MAG: N-6 DNA methylase [Fibrobacteraceae bacterium]|nr:N-6 DNA methylase [Fibrobacteraceae bacterium]